MNVKSRKLNIGCGADIRGGWLNLDSVKLPGVDMVYDLEKLPLPFEENYFEEILCQDILEHVEFLPVLRELWRITAPGGLLRVRSPHFTSKNFYIDPTHKRAFSIRTFDFFVKKLNAKRAYYFDFYFSDVVSAKITFELSSRLFFFNKIVAPIVNYSKGTQNFYESTFLSRLFPAQNVLIELRK